MCGLILRCFGCLFALVLPLCASTAEPAKLSKKSDFQAFTGKITKNKVRLRLQPTLDSPILREMRKGDLVVVIGETEDFYATEPPKETKAFVFRTFVLDNVVEGSRVNVRLEPNMEAPVIAQLNSGDRVDGAISALNSKWLEIMPPASARFYVSKDYVERVGDAALMATMERRREEANTLLNSAYQISQVELQKPFPEIQIDGISSNYKKLIEEYTDFPDQAARAKELLATLQEAYTQKKIIWLEAQAKNNLTISADLQAQREKMNQLQARYEAEITQPLRAPLEPLTVAPNISPWDIVEEKLIAQWLAEHPESTMEKYYQQEATQAVTLSGIVEPYTRAVKNKPGDYVLLSRATHLPMAYLYSTQVNLQNYVGQEVQLRVVSRPNNHFAFSSYFVVSVE